MFPRFFIVLFIVLLSGCSSRLAYNNLDWLVYWYVDDYIEFTEEQEKRFDNVLSVWLQWHKAEELVKYRNHLLDVKEDIDTGEISEDVINQHLERIQGHWTRARDKSMKDMVQLASTMDDEQVTYMFTALEKNNKKQEKRLREQDDDEDPQAARAERIMDNVKDYIGKLTPSQKTLISDYAPQFYATGEDWLVYRRHIQNEARKLFASKDTNEQFEEQLSFLIANPDNYRADEYRQQREQNSQLTIQLFAAIAETLTPKQRKKLIKRINKLIRDIDILTKN